MDHISPAGNTGRLKGITRNAFQHPSADLLSSFATGYATGIACEAGVAVVKINYSKFNSPGIEKNRYFIILVHDPWTQRQKKRRDTGYLLRGGQGKWLKQIR